MKTKEETITWQNQSHLVQRFVETNGYDITLFDLCRITDVMSEYAIKGRTKEVVQKLEAIDDFLKKKVRSIK